MFRRTFIFAVAAGAAGTCRSVARGQDDSGEDTDQARARAAVARGEIRPLAGILADVEQRYEGRVIETELECGHAGWIYEFKILPPTGRIYTVRVDASNGRELGTHGPAQVRH